MGHFLLWLVVLSKKSSFVVSFLISSCNSRSIILMKMSSHRTMMSSLSISSVIWSGRRERASDWIILDPGVWMSFRSSTSGQFWSTWGFCGRIGLPWGKKILEGNVATFQGRGLCPWVLGHIFHSFVVLHRRSVICIHRDGSLRSCLSVVWLLRWQIWRHQIQWWMVSSNRASEALVLSEIHLSTSQMLLDKHLSNSKPNLSLSGRSGVMQYLRSVRWISYKSFRILERIGLVSLLLGLASLWFLPILLDPFWSGFH